MLYFADTRFPIERANGVQTMATCHALAERGRNVVLVVRPDSAPAARDPVRVLRRRTVAAAHGLRDRGTRQPTPAPAPVPEGGVQDPEESPGRRRVHARPRPRGVVSARCRVPIGPGWSTSRTASPRSSAPRCRICSVTAASSPQPPSFGGSSGANAWCGRAPPRTSRSRTRLPTI